MAFTLDEVPKEVMKVWNIQMACSISKTGVGGELWNECQRIINNYPEWFPADPNAELPVKQTT